MPSLYDRLGVERGADMNDIRKAYMKMARTHHPDKGGNPDEFKEIQKAYEILSDDRKRGIYDQTGQEMNDAVQDHSEGIPFGGGVPFGMFGGGGIPFDMGNLFGMFGGPRGPPPDNRAHKPAPKIHQLPISLWDFYHGKKIQVKFNRQKFCTDCGGSGAASYDSCGMCGGSGTKQQVMMLGPGMNVLMQGPCDACEGKGKRAVSTCSGCSGKKMVTQEKSLEVQIEPGMVPGDVLNFENECSDQAEYNEPGDLHIHLQEADEDVRFKRLGKDDLEATTQINLKAALLGCKERMDTHPAHPQGLVVEIPVGVQNGDVIRIEGEGMPRKGGGRGVFCLTVRVTASAEEKTALMKNREYIENMF